MKKNNKKGFTIVELVIVIAVIAILAAVLIPTFSSVIAKANLAADKQTVRQLNVALATGDNVDTYNEMADILVEQGYNGKQTIIPASSGHSYYWVKQYNTIVLVKDGAVVFPEDNKFASLDLTAEGVYAFSAGNYIETVAGSEAFAEAITKGNSVKFSEDIAVSATQTIKKDLTIDLNGFDFDASENISRPFEVDGAADITINATGSEIELGKFGLIKINNANGDVENPTNITIVGGTFKANENLVNGAFLRIASGSGKVNLYLKDVTYIDDRAEQDNSYLNNSQGFKGDLDLIVEGGVFEAPLGFMGVKSITGATITTKGVAVYAADDGVIENCTITVTNEDYKGKYNIPGDGNSNVEGKTPAACVAVDGNANVTVSGCALTSLNGCIFAVYPTQSQPEGIINYEDRENVITNGYAKMFWSNN